MFADANPPIDIIAVSPWETYLPQKLCVQRDAMLARLREIDPVFAEHVKGLRASAMREAINRRWGLAIPDQSAGAYFPAVVLALATDTPRQTPPQTDPAA